MQVNYGFCSMMASSHVKITDVEKLHKRTNGSSAPGMHMNTEKYERVERGMHRIQDRLLRVVLLQEITQVEMECKQI